MESLRVAKDKINNGNWHYIRHLDDIKLLIYIVIDFIHNINPSSIFPNEFNL
jgi:hypothetical protein